MLKTMLKNIVEYSKARNCKTGEIFSCLGSVLCCRLSESDLPLCLRVLKHRASLARGGGIFLPKIVFYDGFLLMWCNFKFEGVLFLSDSRYNDRVDSLWECGTKQEVMTVGQWHRNQTSTGPHLSKIRNCGSLLIIWFSNISILSVPDEGYSRNQSSSCALNQISTFLFVL